MKIAAVEYVNTIPFLHGISTHFHTDAIDIISANPARCADLYFNKEVDIALVPVGALKSLDNYRIITDYCIGSVGTVDTVALLSQVPLEEIKQIHLDSHSRTSANLIQILCSKHWSINPNFITRKNGLAGIQSQLLIGDKVKELESDYRYKYDLGAAWQAYSSLPMVYAVWIAADHVRDGFIDELNASFRFAINNLDQVPLNGYNQSNYWHEYLRNSIHYNLNGLEKKGMQLFIQKCKELNL